MPTYWNRNYRPVAWTWFADIYCGYCATDLADIDPEGNGKHPVYSWEMSDWHANCGDCGESIN